MNESTKRGLRTAAHVVVAVLLAIPAMAAGLPAGAVFAQIIVVAGIVSKIINALEASGQLPDWLKVTAKDEKTAEHGISVAEKMAAQLGGHDPAP